MQQEALLIGIVLALVFRGIFIALGAAVIAQFSWVFYFFGAFLVFTGVKLAREGPEDEDQYRENRLVRYVRTVLPHVEDYRGGRLWVRQSGKWYFTPMFAVAVALGTTDLLFALDSIPAIFGLTQEPYLVLTANVFALMGLRQLYFLLGGLLERLVYLTYGLALLLSFIGVKLVLHALHENEVPFINGGDPVTWAPEISIVTSLAVIVGILGATTVLSLWASRRQSLVERDAHTGPRGH
jgi:tellurite resistance protein TerC